MTTFSAPPPVRWPRWLALAVLATAAGCGSPATFRFQCGPAINDGLLLTIDLIEVNEAEAQQIRQLGDQWFYSDLRQSLEPRKRTVAVQGGCNTSVQLSAQKGYDTLAIISDYKQGSATTPGGNMQFRGKAEWQGKKLDVRVGPASLTLTGGR